ncbi:MAG: hypothetical protein IPM56_17450 [Ignavibacteriales bacterium]|nr:MAG: hypothetical protein IPM56_17450 [Ignavibacteriales bacterium]
MIKKGRNIERMFYFEGINARLKIINGKAVPVKEKISLLLPGLSFKIDLDNQQDKKDNNFYINPQLFI